MGVSFQFERWVKRTPVPDSLESACGLAGPPAAPASRKSGCATTSDKCRDMSIELSARVAAPAPNFPLITAISCSVLRRRAARYRPVADALPHGQPHLGGVAVVRTGNDACHRHLLGEGFDAIPAPHRTASCAVGLVVLSMGSGRSRSCALTTVATVAARMQCAQGYSGCNGVSISGAQMASRSVLSWPSTSPLRMAVTGRHRL